MRGSIATLLLSGAAASLWSVQAQASGCDFTTLGSHCSGDSSWSSQMSGLSAEDVSESDVPVEPANRDTLRPSGLDGKQMDFWGPLDHWERLVLPGTAPLRAPPEAAPLRVASEPAPLSVSSEGFPLRALSGADRPLALFEMVPVPEPGNWAMPIAGLLGMYAVVRRRTISS